jgi:uncharacterized protein (DUF2249 family)
MSWTDLFRKSRGACKCSQQAKSAEIAPIDLAAARPGAAEPGAEDATVGISRTIDVSHLPPPLPMVRILETLRALGPGETLLVNHTRRPIHLYPKLDALGCTHATTESSTGKIEVRITNPPARSS